MYAVIVVATTAQNIHQKFGDWYQVGIPWVSVTQTRLGLPTYISACCLDLPFNKEKYVEFIKCLVKTIRWFYLVFVNQTFFFINTCIFSNILCHIKTSFPHFEFLFLIKLLIIFIFFALFMQFRTAQHLHTYSCTYVHIQVYTCMCCLFDLYILFDFIIENLRLN